MIKTDEVETVQCEDCSGTGKAPTVHHCPGCDHEHPGTVDCEWCEGAGTRTYPVWESDPDNCRYCAKGELHPLSVMLSELQVARGGIKFS